MPDSGAQRPSDTEEIVRGCDSDCVRSDRTVKKCAFIPRRNGKDDDGLSVSLRNLENEEDLRARLRQPPPDRTLVGLQPGLVRTIKASEDCAALDVIPNPQPNDPHHCLITGIPTGKGIEDIARANRLAELLAKIAKPI
jgi:hypothetical protein